MSKRNGDMPAMPLHNEGWPSSLNVVTENSLNDDLCTGLTKREKFAMAAMQGLCADGQTHLLIIPTEAVKMADALLAELDKDGGE